MLESIPHLLEQIDPMLAYAILVVSAFVENVFPPIPGDTITVLGAYLVSTGKLGFWGVYFSTTIGSVIGFFTMYLLGLKLGTKILKAHWTKKTFSEDRIKKVENWFTNYGYWVIAANRFLSGTRSVVSIFAGFFSLRWYWVLLLSLVSALIWNGLLIYAGYLVGVHWEKITVLLKEYNKWVLIMMALAVALYAAYRFFYKKREV